MKVTTKDNTIQLEEVFNSIVLKSESGQTMAICMRDNGFEFKYNGIWYEAKDGFIELLEDDERLAEQRQNAEANPRAYSMEDVQKCIEHWGFSRVPEESIDKFLNKSEKG